MGEVARRYNGKEILKKVGASSMCGKSATDGSSQRRCLLLNVQPRTPLHPFVMHPETEPVSPFQTPLSRLRMFPCGLQVSVTKPLRPNQHSTGQSKGVHLLMAGRGLQIRHLSHSKAENPPPEPRSFRVLSFDLSLRLLARALMREVE